MNSSQDPETHTVIGLAFSVHNVRIPYIREKPVPVHYKSTILPSPYRADFVCFDDLLVELKAIKALTTIEDAQVLHYIKATRIQKALLLNFGTPRLEFKRFIKSYPPQTLSA
ncbi:MAG: GxxExxY protein [Terrimicrobiaceae bacterium]|nr:GxxExxY protein [Terrimicrobiaceae bacterium]